MPEKSTKPTRKRAASPKAAIKPKREAGYEEIAQRAYYIFLDEGHGDDLANWLRAERELTAA